MKKSKTKLDTELDVDFIGGLGSLTKEDEKVISAFIKANKIKRAKAEARSIKAKSAPAKGKRSISAK